MVESIRDICAKYNCNEETKQIVAKICSSFFARTENLKILKGHIISLERNTLYKIDSDPRSKMNVSEILKFVETDIARTYFEAYVNATFSLTDIAAMFCYYLLNLNYDPYKLYFNYLVTKKEINFEQNYKKTYDLIDTFIKSQEYKYFNDLNNYIKHRSIVSAPYTLKLDTVTNFYSINEFKYKNRTYNTVTSDELFKLSDTFIKNLKNCINSLE